MDASIKVNRTVSKTIEATTVADLDDDYATFVQTLTEAQLIDTHFAFISGKYVIVIIYIPG